MISPYSADPNETRFGKCSFTNSCDTDGLQQPDLQQYHPPPSVLLTSGAAVIAAPLHNLSSSHLYHIHTAPMNFFRIILGGLGEGLFYSEKAYASEAGKARA
ncbi:unnamed protein product [Somion occarium]|uniref:Plastocyanin-like domain-containing protein n=1 Tax=Somion occarium TaxID=3059160 RepID=A0ABP1E7V3_9APHY